MFEHARRATDRGYDRRLPDDIGEVARLERAGVKRLNDLRGVNSPEVADYNHQLRRHVEQLLELTDPEFVAASLENQYISDLERMYNHYRLDSANFPNLEAVRAALTPGILEEASTMSRPILVIRRKEESPASLLNAIDTRPLPGHAAIYANLADPSAPTTDANEWVVKIVEGSESTASLPDNHQGRGQQVIDDISTYLHLYMTSSVNGRQLDKEGVTVIKPENAPAQYAYWEYDVLHISSTPPPDRPQKTVSRHEIDVPLTPPLDTMAKSDALEVA